MFKMVVDGSYFVDEAALLFIDEAHSIVDPASGETRNVGTLAEQLAETICLCADGMPLTSVEQVCTAIRAFVSLVEQCAYVEGALAQRDGREVIQTRIVGDAKYWNSTSMDNEMEDDGNV